MKNKRVRIEEVESLKRLKRNCKWEHTRNSTYFPNWVFVVVVVVWNGGMYGSSWSVEESKGLGYVYL